MKQRSTSAFGAALAILVATALSCDAGEASTSPPTAPGQTTRYLITWHGAAWETYSKDTRLSKYTRTFHSETSGTAITEYDGNLKLKTTRYLDLSIRDTDESMDTAHEVEGWEHILSITNDEGRYAGYVAMGPYGLGALMPIAPELYYRNPATRHAPFRGLQSLDVVRKTHWEQHSPSGDTEGGRTERGRSEAGAANSSAVDFERDPHDPTAFRLSASFTLTLSKVRQEEGRWTARAIRLGRCYGRDYLKEGDPLIYNERLDLEATPSEIDIDKYATVKLRVTCDQVPIENAEVEVELVPQDNSGGHMHSENRPKGYLDQTDMTEQRPCPVAGQVVSSGYGPTAWPPCIKVRTGRDGTKTLIFRPASGKPVLNRNGQVMPKARIAGIYVVTARPTLYPHNQRTTAIVASVKDLFQLPHEADMVPDGETATHPVNHYASVGTLNAFEGLAAEFKQMQDDMNVHLQTCQQRWATAPLKVNDIALPTGGLFDIGNKAYVLDEFWRTPHQTHGRGQGGDFDHFPEYNQDARGKNATVTDCDGKTYKLGDVLGLLLLALGEPTYGCWDLTDLRLKNAMWHLHVDDKRPYCGVW